MTKIASRDLWPPNAHACAHVPLQGTLMLKANALCTVDAKFRVSVQQELEEHSYPPSPSGHFLSDIVANPLLKIFFFK